MVQRVIEPTDCRGVRRRTERERIPHRHRLDRERGEAEESQGLDRELGEAEESQGQPASQPERSALIHCTLLQKKQRIARA